MHRKEGISAMVTLATTPRRAVLRSAGPTRFLITPVAPPDRLRLARGFVYGSLLGAGLWGLIILAVRGLT
jgi:hypothetical protein